MSHHEYGLDVVGASRRTLPKPGAGLRAATTRVFHALVVLSLAAPNFAVPSPHSWAPSADEGQPMRAQAETAPVDPFVRPVFARPAARYGQHGQEETPTETPATPSETIEATVSPTAETQTLAAAETGTPIPSTGTPAPSSSPLPLGIQQRAAPLLFIENVGQFDSRSRFEVRGGRAFGHLADDALWFTLFEPLRAQQEASADSPVPTPAAPTDQISTPSADSSRRGVHLKLDFVGANPHPEIVPFGPIDTTISYFLGNDPEQWYPDVPVWSGVRYVDLYPGVDLEIESTGGVWDWRLVVRDAVQFEDDLRGAARRGIRLHIEGHGRLSLAEQGILVISTEVGDLGFPVPAIVLPEGMTLEGRSLEPIVTDRELILLSAVEEPTATATIEPTATATETVTLTPTEEPTATETVTLPPTEEPTATPSPEATPSDTATPSPEPSLTDTPEAIPTPLAFEPQPPAGGRGLAAPAAALRSADEPAAFAAPVLAIDDLVYSTYLGGSGEDNALGNAVDALGSIYIVGTTPSTDFPVTPGSFDTSYGGGTADVFVTKMSADGSEQVYSTFIGGSSTDCHWDCAIAVDSTGAAYITGATMSSDYPTTAGGYDLTRNGTDGFLTKLTPSGTALAYSTFFGGGATEIPHSVALETSSAVYVTGMTDSSDFPTSTWAWDRTRNGVQDAFVVEFNPNASGQSSLVYSTLLGGSGADQGHGIAVLNGFAYVTGQTFSTDFPTTTGSYDQSANGGWDSYVTKLDQDGSDLVYSTYLGGSGTDCELAGDFSECDIAVDASGFAVVTGGTGSSDFPMWNAMDNSLGGGSDAYVTKLSANGSALIFSTYLGGSDGDSGWAIATDSDGSIYVAGGTHSRDFPTTPNAYDPTQNGLEDGYLTKLAADGSGALYSTCLGGTSYDSAFDVAVDAIWTAYVAGKTRSADFPTTSNAFDRTLGGTQDGYAVRISLAAYNTIVYDLSTTSFCDPENGAGPCPWEQGQASTQGRQGDPINTRTGAFDYSLIDLSVPTSAGGLAFVRTYSSVSTDRFAALLGYGWTHNHDVRLIFSDDPGGEPGVVLLKADSTNLFRFLDNGDGTYTPTAGVLSTLTRDPGPPVRFTIRAPSQETLVFDEDGLILRREDPQAHAWTYTYAAGRLDRVTDDTGQRYLDFSYDGQGRIQTVSDQGGRDVTFSYDASGDLTTFVDGLDNTWILTYDSAHRLRIVEDGAGAEVLHTEYDVQGRAYRQFDPSGTLILEVTYNADGTANVTDSLGNQLTDAYDARRTLVERTDDAGGTEGRSYDANFRPSVVADESGNAVRMLWSPDGADLLRLTDAEDNQTDLTYDAYHNLTSVADPRDYLTTYVYNISDPDPARRTLLLEVEDALSNTTTFTYTTAAHAPQPPGLLRTITDALGHTTTFVYNAFGQRMSSTDALGHTTSYAYDALGRLQRTTDALGHATWTCYDAAGRVVRTVANATGDGGTPQTGPCNAASYIPSPDPDKDRVTTTVYDESGNVIATIDPSGSITRAYYDADLRPEYVVVNLVGQGIEIPTPPAYDPAYPDRNLRTQTVYDNQGNAIATVDTLGVITRTYYDALNRPEYVVVNLLGQGIGVSTPPAYDPAFPDRNTRTQFFYDAAGNAIAIRDNAGHITRTYYDANSRPFSVVQNLTGQAVDNPTPPSRNPSTPDQNLRTDTVYDASGNAIATINPAGVITRTYYDALSRPITAVQNLYGQGIEIGTPPVFNPTYPYRNVITDYYYDEAGNQIAVVDTLGVVTRTYYDVANRPEYVVQNLQGQGIYVTTPPVYNPAYPDENVRTQTVYDDAGQAIATIDTLERITRTYYDGLGRARYVVRNLTGQAISVPTPPAYNPTYPDQNVRTETIYDASGNAIATIDNAGTITRSYYDAVHRVRHVTQNLIGQDVSNPTPPAFNPTYPDRNVTSETQYNGAGSVIRTVDPIGGVTHTCYDGQQRVVKSIENPSVTSPCGSYTPSPDTDRDIITLATYDDAGNRKTVTDPNGKATTYAYDAVYRLTSETDPLSHMTSFSYDVVGNRTSSTDARNIVTRFEYDALGRLTAVVENYKSGQPADAQTNVRTEYGYDGRGNRRTITDARSHATTFTYDDLGRLATESDALSHTTTYGYDGARNRVSLLDANGHTTTFTYDGLNRLTFINYPSPDADVTYTYDDSGNRHTMVDGQGMTTWNYDDLNRATAVTDPYSAVVTYAYNAAGLRTVLTYPDTRQVAYTYDLAGRLHLVTDWDSLITTYTYDRGSRSATTSFPNGVVSTYTFDDANRLTSLAHVNGPTTLSSFSYGYDNVGNRTSVTETVLQPDTTPTDVIFADGFESGDLSAWSAARTDGGDLSVTTPPAIAGTYGMQAVVDDNNSIYVSDWTPQAESQYRARFYFDPNSISMLNGEAHYLLQALNASSTVVARLELRSYEGDYQVRAEAVNDATTWTSTSWYTIRDQMHYIEFNWQAATAAGANNGVLTLWIDGTQTGTFTNIDNDTRRVETVHFGAVSGIDSGTRGTYYFDLFESHRLNYIGADPSAPTPPPPPTPPENVFADGFESGSFSAWSATATDGGDLTVTTAAAIAGTYGMQAVLDDNNSIYATDWTPFEDNRYRARFHFDPNSVAMNGGDAHYLFYALNRDGVVVARIELRYNYGDYQVRAEVVNDSTGWSSSAWVAITDGPHALEFNWQAATAAGANNGVLTLWVDGTQIATFTNIDNDTRRVDLARLGGVAGVDNGTRGTEYFDCFESRRTTYIGPDPGAPTPPPWPPKNDPLFSDGFESGSFSAWTWAQTDGGDLSVTTAAALVGTYGMQALLDDNNSIYVNDWTPFEETRYRARFHFDPNTLGMSGGDAFYLFYAGNRDSVIVARIELRMNYGDYQVRAEAINDSNGWSSSPWVAITDGPHALEFNWQAATAAGANNGIFTFWVDGAQIATFTNIDDDTRRVEYVQLGAVSGVDTGTRGTSYFDAFVSRRETYIGPDPGAPTPPPWPPKNDPLFSDGFESGSFSAWTWAQTDGGDLSVTTAAAIAGTYGMQALLDDNNSIYVNDWTPFEETRYRARFYFDPNTVTMANNDAHYPFYAGNRDSVIVTRIEFRRYSSTYQVRAEVVNDSGGWTSSSWVTISDAPHYLEIDWRASSAPGANNGGLTFWVDGAQQANFTTVDNDTRRVEYVQLGAVAGVDTGSRGTTYFDAFESRRTSYIGPVAGLLPEHWMVRLPSWQGLVSLFTSPSGAELAAPVVTAQPVSAEGPAAAATPTPPPMGTPIPQPVGLASRMRAAPAALPGEAPPPRNEAAVVSRTITYTYDNLYRLTAADYSDGIYFHYTYDATGNRLTEEVAGGLMISYTYDNANRLTSVDGVPLSWDNSGNLLSDGVRTYTYDHANRLASATRGSSTYAFGYNGQGDRLRQTANGTPTTYVLDLNAGLTEVLATGGNAYLYGNGRIGEEQPAGWAYHLGDALGSVRQLVDASASVSLARSYEPFGDPLSSVGTGTSIFQYTGQQVDATGLVYLRARYYEPGVGRFLSRDIWEGDPNQPMSYNTWLYAYGNPTNMIDPSGMICDGWRCATYPGDRSFVSSSAARAVASATCDERSILALISPPDKGYFEGRSVVAAFTEGDISGDEIMYDFATMTRARFTYVGRVGFVVASLSASAYAGTLWGLTYDGNPQTGMATMTSDYSGPFKGAYGGVGFGILTVGGGYFQDPQGRVHGVFDYYSVGASIPGELVGFETEYARAPFEESYVDPSGNVDEGRLIWQILTGSRSPAIGLLGGAATGIATARSTAIGTALEQATLYEILAGVLPWPPNPGRRR